MKMDFLKLHSFTIPVCRTLFDNDDFINFPLVENERAIANKVARESPTVVRLINTTVFFYRWNVHGEPRVMV